MTYSATINGHPIDGAAHRKTGRPVDIAQDVVPLADLDEVIEIHGPRGGLYRYKAFGPLHNGHPTTVVKAR